MSRELWSPFDKDGRLRVTLTTDPWWKRLRAKLRREPLWVDAGVIRER